MAKPFIKKLGTIDIDLVETTPIAYKQTLYRFEYVRKEYWANQTGDSYFRFVNHDTGEVSPAFAKGYHLGNVLVEGNVLYVTGTNIWDGERVDIFSSNDMIHWETWNALNLPGYGIFNTSICRVIDHYLLMFEIGRPVDVVGVPFTARFATSNDMKHWELTNPACQYSKDRYTAPHCVRYLEGYYYNFYLEAVFGGYEQYVVRSRDLINWESSPYNPVLAPSEEDHIVYNSKLNPEQRERVAIAINVNNSDIDFCQYNQRLVINYSWGNQLGIEHLAEAEFEGTLEEFLKAWFPK